ncbi:MAG: hypothetical protein ABSD77_02735 [Verrucomicrobiota bacterium]|jgi:hypothetical protein
MKTPKEQTQPETEKQKRDYVKPDIKKREQIREVTEGDEVFVTTETKR